MKWISVKDSQEAKEWIQSLFPIGQERWIKIEVLDPEKCFMDAFRMTNGERTTEKERELGYKVTAISYADDADLLNALLNLQKQIQAEIETISTKRVLPRY